MSSPHRQPNYAQEVKEGSQGEVPSTPAPSSFSKLMESQEKANRDLSDFLEKEAREADRARRAVEKYSRAQLDNPHQKSYSSKDARPAAPPIGQFQSNPSPQFHPSWNPLYNPSPHFPGNNATPTQTQFDVAEQHSRLQALEGALNQTLAKIVPFVEKQEEEKRRKATAKKEKRQNFYGQESGISSDSDPEPQGNAAHTRINASPTSMGMSQAGILSNIYGAHIDPDHTRGFGDPDHAKMQMLKDEIAFLKTDSKNNYIRELNPVYSLNSAMKNNKNTVVSTNSVSLPPWKDYMDALFASCYLTALSLMQSRVVPKSIDEWKRMDASKQCQESKALTLRNFKASPRVLPNAQEFDSVAKLNGILLAVVESWPVVLNALHVALVATLDPTMLHLRTTKEMTLYTFRSIYFGVLFTFHLPATEEKSLELEKFMTGQEMKYRSHESPEAFALRLSKKAKDTNLVFGTVVISPELLRSRFVLNLRLGTGQKFINILDRSDDLGFTELVAQLQAKWKAEKVYSMMGGEHANHLVGSGDEGSDDDSAYFNAKFNSKNPDKSLKFSDKFNKDRKDRKNQPCFRMRDTGDCRFGSDCKYSHDPDILRTALKKAFLIDQLRDAEVQLVLLEQANAALKEGRALWKRRFKKDKVTRNPKQKSGSKPSGSKKTPHGNVTFEQAVGEANLVAPTKDSPNSEHGGDAGDVSDSSATDTESDFE